MGIVLDRARWLSNGGGQDGNTPVHGTHRGWFVLCAGRKTVPA